MKKREIVKPFEWKVESYDIDFDYFELNLHSLYKENNFGFNEDIYRRELVAAQGNLTKVNSTAIRLALKSFTKSFLFGLDSHGIELDLKWNDITDYGQYELVTHNLVTTEIKGHLLEGIKGTGTIVNTDEFTTTTKTFKYSALDRLFFVASTPAILGINIASKKNHITLGATVNNMRKDLLKFEQSVVESAVQQFVRERNRARSRTSE